VLIIGDSIAYGYGVKQNETFSAQLENLLATYWQDEELHFEVFNLGVTGYNIDQVLENLRERGLQFDPDLIIYAYCLNDPMVYSFEYERLKAQLSSPKATYRDELLDRGGSIAGNLRIYLLTKYALRVLRSKWFSDANPDDAQWAAIADGSYSQFFTAAYEEPDAEDRLRSGVETLQKISQSTGVPVVTIIFPIFYEFAKYKVKHLHEHVQELHVDYGARVYDLLELYTNMDESEGRVFVGNVLHPNAIGHRLGALYVLLRLAEDGLLPLSTGWQGKPMQSDRTIVKAVEQTMHKSE
jgi:lysophospholipase L1-like esterase